MTAPAACGCRIDRLCPEHLADRQRVVAERLAYLARRVQLRAVEPKPKMDVER